MVKDLPAKACLPNSGSEDPLEKEMKTHSTIVAWEIPWTEEPGRLYSPWSHKESDMTQQLITTKIELFVLQIKSEKFMCF